MHTIRSSAAAHNEPCSCVMLSRKSGTLEEPTQPGYLGSRHRSRGNTSSSSDGMSGGSRSQSRSTSTTTTTAAGTLSSDHYRTRRGLTSGSSVSNGMSGGSHSQSRSTSTTTTRAAGTLSSDRHRTHHGSTSRVSTTIGGDTGCVSQPDWPAVIIINHYQAPQITAGQSGCDTQPDVPTLTCAPGAHVRKTLILSLVYSFMFRGDDDNVTLISKLDVSHPLHLHPHDSMALTVVSMKLKGTKNYQVWSCAMLLALEGKTKTRFIDGLVEETYDKVDGSVTFSLHHKIHALSQNRSSITDYYHKLNALWKQFNALIELPRCTCHAADDFKKQIHLLKLMQFLIGLDDTYMQIRSYILSRETLPNVRNAYAIISSEESHRIATGSVSQASTSFSRPSNNNKPNDNGNRRTAGSSTLVCENYGFNGHTIDICFKIIRYPADFGKKKVGSNLKGKNISNNVVGSNSSNGFSDKQMATLISLIKENYVNGKGVHSNRAGTYMNSSTMFNKNFEKFFCSNSSLHSKLVFKGLITDSGANQHITYTDKNLIDVINISYLKIKVTHPNGTKAFITRIGNMPLTDYLTLYDVLVVPEYCVSLMSVHKVARDSKLVIAFDEMHCYVMNQDLRKGKILGTGKQIGGLYYFDVNQGIPLNMWPECVLTATYLINRLPTFILNEKSPYDLVYNKPLSLKHLRSFGCLAYATILNNHDKFESRDVKFFKDIFPFKQNNSTGIDNPVQDVNHLNFFNTNTLDDLPEIPNDEERRNPNPIRYGNSPSHSGSTSAFSKENDAGHSQDADASASENGSFVADEENKSNYEGNGLHDQSHDNEIVDLPVGRKAIGSKWVRKIKYKSDGEIERYKARLVAKGFNQKEGINFDETFSSVVKIGDLEETVYMTLPPGYFPDNETKVCKLNKSLYGLKQAPRKWNAKITADLLENNFVQSKSDYSLFTKSFGDVFSTLLVYVDDIIITGNSLTEIEKVKQFLKTKFMIKDLGKLEYFLGIKVSDTPKGICLNQRKYCLELIDEFGILARKLSNLPMQPNISLTTEPSDTNPLLDNVTEYQKLIGKLIYLTTTRPNIAYTVSYLRSASSIDLKAYSDADMARCTNTRRSITGYYVFMFGSLVSWKSKKQNTISKSSTEAAEYRALASVTSEVIWILKILKYLKCFNLLPVKVFCDSNFAIKIAANLIFHERTKHLEIDLHFFSVTLGSRCKLLKDEGPEMPS
ncbi:ribonuclease H-like domain-containing protein [Tanacetum coccineum]